MRFLFQPARKTVGITLFLLLPMCLLLIGTNTTYGQAPATGFPPFGTFNRDSIDTVNVANLNVHFAFPVFVKKGRGLDFAPSITHDNSVLQVTYTQVGGYAFQLTPFGTDWSTNTPMRAFVQYTSSGAICNYGGYQYNAVVDNNFIYTDNNNTAHIFTSLQVGSTPCYSHTASGSSPDGYALTVSVDPNQGQIISETIYDPAGNKIVPGTSITDPNGNNITETVTYGNVQTTTWADTTGNAALILQPTFNAQGYLSSGTYTYPSPSGGTPETVTATYSMFTIKTQFACPNVSDINQPNVALATSIALPDGTAYAIVYESTTGTYPSTVVTGRIHSLTVPSGATITYSYSGGVNGINCDGTPAVMTKQTPDGTWTYNRAGGPYTATTTVTDPQGNDTVYTFGRLNASATNYAEIQRLIYQGSHTSGTLLKTLVTCYNAIFTNCAANWDLPAYITQKDVYTTPSGGTTALSEIKYDNLGRVTQDKEYDYGINTGSAPTGTPIRSTLTAYASPGNNISDHPSCVQITTGAPPVTCGTVTSSTASLTNYLNYDTHGNLGKLQSFVSGSTYVSRVFTYYSTGLVNTATDFNQNPTTYTYGDCNSSYPSQIVSGGLSQSFTWDCNGGVIKTATDANNQVTSYQYNDPFWRLTQTNYPDGGQTTITYNDTASPSNTVTSQKLDSTNRSLTTQTNFDGLGRPIQNMITSDVNGTDRTVTTYDVLGRVSSIYNPTRCNPPTTNCGEPTWGYTSYQYDALSRVTQVTEPDGSIATTSYTGNAATSTDEAGHPRKTAADALGRLTTVWEPDGSNNLTVQTTYTYDAANNLRSVVQNGSRQRTFVYDALSHLTSTTNPESGTTTYVYDSNGNVVSKTAPAPNQTGSSTVTLSYCYNSLNQMISKAYTSQSCPMASPVATYSYGQASCLGQSSCYNLGRRTGMTDPGGSESWSYDSMGRPIADQRTTNSIAKSTTYAYNYDGTIWKLTYPGGFTVTYTYNAAGQASSVVDTANNITYATAGAYNPPGALTALTLGPAGSFAGINLNNSYNNRLQPAEMKATSTAGTALDLTYCFRNWVSNACQTTGGNNGNVNGITNNLSGTRTQSFAYDHLNRVATASSSTWSLTFGYDAWGNLLTAAATGTATPLNVTVGTNNRITTAPFAFDSAGNETADATSTYAWNAENKLVGGGGVTYVYDGDGERVQKSNGKIYWHSMDGKVLNESDLSGNVQEWYVYFNGVPIGHHNSSGQYFYYLRDLIGTSRKITNSAGAVCYDADLYPFGGEQLFTNTCAQNYKFTGKERDIETNNDYFGARHYSPTVGRFLSPDPAGIFAADAANPQSWNLYNYVLNNPLKFTDPIGLYCYYGSLDSVSDALDNSQYDFRTNQKECEDNQGHWTPDQETTIQVPADGSCPISNFVCQEEYKQSRGPAIGRTLACAAQNANTLSLAGLIDVDEKKHPLGAALTKGFLGNTFSGIVDTGSHMAAALAATNASSRALAVTQFAGDLAIGGAGQGLPIAANNIWGKGVAGAATDVVVNAATKSSGILSLTGTGTELAEEGLAGPIGWGKLAIDGVIFLGSAAYCVATQ
jgi:RHS repeat-associated protein